VRTFWVRLTGRPEGLHYVRSLPFIIHAGTTRIAAVRNNLLHQSRYAEAEKLQEDTLDIQRRVLGPDHPNTAASVYNLAIVKVRKRDPAEALRLLHEAVTHGLSPSDCLGLEKDPDLKSLHGDPRFEAVVADARSRAKGVQ
jgi:hypothetical protein